MVLDPLLSSAAQARDGSGNPKAGDKAGSHAAVPLVHVTAGLHPRLGSSPAENKTQAGACRHLRSYGVAGDSSKLGSALDGTMPKPVSFSAETQYLHSPQAYTEAY